MLRVLIVLPPVLLLAMLPQQPAAPTTAPVLPPDATTLVNPVKPTTESQVRAKAIFAMDCAICHGVKGDGKGDLVADLHLTVKDFADPATLQGKSDGELFYTIKNGNEKDKMPAEGPRAKDAEIWNLVLLVRSYGSK